MELSYNKLGRQYMPVFFYKCATILSKPVLTINLTKLPWVLESSETSREYIKLYFETKLANLRYTIFHKFFNKMS